MAKKKRVRKPGEMSLAQLRQLVDEKSSELSDLKAQRAEKQKELNELDRLIRETEGAGGKRRGRGRKKAYGAGTAKSPARKKKKVSRKRKVKRAKNTQSAKAYAKEILNNEPKGLTLDELSKQILANGYKTNSSNFKNTLYQSLYKDRNEVGTFAYSDKTGRWTLI